MTDEPRTAYFDALLAGDASRVRRALDGTPELVRETLPQDRAPMNLSGMTGLHVAVQVDSPEIARMLLDAGIDIEARNSYGRTALHDSIEDSRMEIQRMLLDRGAVVDVCAAAILGKVDRLRELLNADPALANDRSTNLSPLGWASYGNRPDTAGELIDRGARMDDGELLCAASVGHVEVGRLLLDRGADPDAIQEDAGGNALHAAAASKYTDDTTRFVKMLLGAGADRTIRTTKGKTALEIAEAGALRQQEQPPAEGTFPGRRNFEGVIALLKG